MRHSNQQHVQGRGASSISQSNNSALRQSSIDASSVPQQHPSMTPVQQKQQFGQQLFHSAAINNYLTSGSHVVNDQSQQQQQPQHTHQPKSRVQAQEQSHSAQNHHYPVQQQYVSLNQAPLKKSEIKQLQKYCESNGLDFNKMYGSNSQSRYSIADFSQSNQQQPQQQPKSLSKERKFINPQSYAAQSHLIKGSTAANSHSHKTAQSHRPTKSSNAQSYSNQYQHTSGSLHNTNNNSGTSLYQSGSTQIIDRSPIVQQSSAKHHQNAQRSSNSGSGHQHQLSMVNLSAQQSASNQYVLETKQSQPGKGVATVQQSSLQSTKRAPDWKKNAMMPSQMSINDAKHHPSQQSNQQDPTSQLANMYKNKGYDSNVSASNGYLSQKASPMGRLSVERPNKQLMNDIGNKSSSKVVRYPYVPGKQHQSKSSIHQSSTRRSSQENNKDLQIAYSNHKMHGGLSSNNVNSNSASSLDKNFHHHQVNHHPIDSGAGVITKGGGVSGQQHVHQHHTRPSGHQQQQRGIQVEMKSNAIQSRRKHGSIDTYKQSTNNRDLSQNSSNKIIRQGQGEIAPQRVSAAMAVKGSVYAKSSGKPINQLPKVVRNPTNQSSVKTNVSASDNNNGFSGVTRAHQNSNTQMNSSTPSITTSGQKNPNVSRLSPSDEIRYQGSNYTNAIRQSALSRGTIKQSSQQALSGSNHMNLSLSQTSSRGLQKSHKDNSVEQIQERRIAYEASQGKMSQGNQGPRVSNANHHNTGSKEMLLAQSAQQVNQQNGSSNLPKTIVLTQQMQQQNHQHNNAKPGSNPRHSRIRTNHSSLEKVSNNNNQGWNQSKAMVSEHPIQGKATKRGAITQANNSPRQVLSQLKNQKPKIPNSTSRVDVEGRYANQSSSQPTLEEQRQAYKHAQAMKMAASQSTRKSLETREEHLTTADFAPHGGVNQREKVSSVSRIQGSMQQASGSRVTTPINDEEYLQYVQQQNSAQSRYDDQNSIEQYSRKLHTPNPILDGGTGSGGAQTIQNQTKQLLKEQQMMLERLGYKSQNNFLSEPQNRDLGQLTAQRKVENSSQNGLVISGQVTPVGQHNHHSNPAKNLSAYQQQPGKHVFGLDQQSIKTQNVYQKQHQNSVSSSTRHHSKGDSKKAILLQMQGNNLLKNETHQSGSSTNVLNLSHHVATGSVSLAKSVNTKTSAQTANTAFTMKAGHQQHLQYSSNSKHQLNSGQVNHKSGSQLKLKKTSSVAQSQPHNLIMHQHSSKRSNSQEMILVPNQQQKQGNQYQQSSSNEQQLNIIVRSSQITGANNQKVASDKRHQNTASVKHGLKSDKRSSSQPTVLATNAAELAANGKCYQHPAQANMPKHYQEDKKKMYYQQKRRGSDDPINSRQVQHEGRSSQPSLRASLQEQHHSGSARQLHPPQQQNINRQPSQVNLDSLRVVQVDAQQIAIDNKKSNHNHGDKKSQVTKRSIKKQSSVPQLNLPVNNAGIAIGGGPIYEKVQSGELSKKSAVSKQSSQNTKHSRKSKSSGPVRPQYSVNQPPQMPVLITDDMLNDNRRLITEDDEQEIRQVASDINEKAFFGKILRTKKAIDNEGEFGKLSPRSQEIGYVMQKLQNAFRQNGQPPLTDITFYRIGKMLGRGAFGKVNLAMHKIVRKLVALKSLNKQALTDEVQKAKLMKEVNLLLKLRHNHVVKIYETIETQKHIIIVMELCAGGDLLNYVRKRRRLKEPFAQKIFKQIIDGLNYTHSKNIAHRDIKLDNILLDGKGNVKIADFGVSRQIQPDQVMREQCGTPAYIAPEILRNRGYSLNVDIWSAGVVLFAMLYGTVPFKAQTMDELHQLILKGKYLLKEDISTEARDLLRGLLEINPKKRLTVRQINKHPWLRGMDSSVQLFNDEERKMIKKEYTYNDGSRYNRNENEEPIDCFTLHHLESQFSTLKNQDSKSIILAPFNSTMSEQSVDENNFTAAKSKMLELMEIKQQVLRFSKKCREIDRQYEFNNNGQLDNGVYHKVVANNSFEQQDKYEETQGIEVEQTLHSIKDQIKRGKSQNAQPNARNDNALSASEQSSFLSMAEQYQIQNNQQKTLDPIKVSKLVSFGYPEQYIVQNMREMQPNYCTAGYYLMEMDQNYC